MPCPLWKKGRLISRGLGSVLNKLGLHARALPAPIITHARRTDQSPAFGLN